MTRAKGAQDFAPGVRERSAILKKHGCISARAGRCPIGPHPGQVIIVYTFADAAAFGRAIDAAASDPDFQRSLAEFNRNFEVMERYLVVGEEF